MSSWKMLLGVSAPSEAPDGEAEQAHRNRTSRTGSKEQRIVERFMIFDPLLPIVSQQFQRNAGYLQLEYTICK